MSEVSSNISYVRTDEVPREPPPVTSSGVIGWMKENLFSSIPNTILTLIGVYIIYLLVPPVLKFSLIDAVFTGTGRDDCLAAEADRDQALARYQALRRDRAERVIGAANGNAWKYHLRSGPLRGAAHLALRLGGRLAPERMVRRFDWLYGHDVTAG